MLTNYACEHVSIKVKVVNFVILPGITKKGLTFHQTNFLTMAEVQRFELWRVTRPYRFSRPTPSATWVHLQIGGPSRI